MADNFEALARIEDWANCAAACAKTSPRCANRSKQMRRESEESVRRLESQVTAFEERVEAARKESGVDRLTGLGSRREAERHLQKAAKRESPVCLLLFDVEGFRAINHRHGSLFGDKLLRALARKLRERFPGEGVLFRWAADEFLAMAEGSLASRLDQCRGICESFAESNFYIADGGIEETGHRAGGLRRRALPGPRGEHRRLVPPGARRAGAESPGAGAMTTPEMERSSPS